MYGTDARPVPPKTSIADDNFVYDLSVFVLDTPGNREIIQASGSLPDPWAVSPLCGSHRAASRRKSHYAVMDLGLNPGTVRLLQASCRSDLSTVFAFTADVAPHHRFVPDECVFSCQGAFSFSLCNNSVVTSHILEKKTPFAVGLAAHIMCVGSAHFSVYSLSATKESSCITSKSCSFGFFIPAEPPFNK